MTHANRLLAAVEPDILGKFEAELELVELGQGDVLHLPGAVVEEVFFPEGALIGVVTGAPSGEALQTCLVGSDGALGAFEACGTRRNMFLAEVHAPGAAWRMTAADYRRLFDASAGLRTAVHMYVELQLTEARQFVACNALHAVEARLARTLLEASDRWGGPTVPITQKVLAEALGVQRTTVSTALSELERPGAVRGRRGAVEIVDAEALERMACSCRRLLLQARAEIEASPEQSCDAGLVKAA